MLIAVKQVTATPFPAMADEAMVLQAMADEVTETADLSVEEAFFEHAAGSSDRPVSFDFDAELWEPSLDLEARELRRVHFKRVVGGIIAALGVGALLALVQAGPKPAEAAPAVVFYAAPVELPEMQLVEPASAVSPPAASVSIETAPAPSAVKTPPRAVVSAAPRTVRAH